LYYIGCASAEGTTSTGSIQDEADWKALQDGDQLNEKYINAANTILTKQFPNQAGFQHTLRYQSAQKPITPQTKGGTIQLHNVRSNHWVTTVCSGGVIRLFDSLYTGTIDNDFAEQLRVTYRKSDSASDPGTAAA